MPETNEVWQAIPDFEGIYEVSNFGRVRSVRKSKRSPKGYILKPFPTKWGYLLICLRDFGRKKVIAVHRIVAHVFMGDPQDEGLEVNHIDGDKTNNRVDNLEYVTRSENLRHAYRIGLRIGARSKLTDSQVNRIRDMSKKGMSNTAIAKEFNIDQSSISRLLSGKTYRRVRK